MFTSLSLTADHPAHFAIPTGPTTQWRDLRHVTRDSRRIWVDNDLAMSRGVWTVIVGIFGAIAIAAPVKIVNNHVGQSSSSTGTVAGNPVIHMAGLMFSPGTIVVRKGATAVFDNNDVAPHTVTEDTAGGVDSGVMSPGQQFRLVVGRRLVYHCTIHPFMKARIDLAG
jgi:plastocyanin